MSCIQVCLVLVASCAVLASADLTSYKFGYSANDLGTVELDAPALSSIKDCDPVASSYLVTGSTPAPVMRSAVEIEPASIISMTPSPILSTASEFVSLSTPAPILRTAIDIEPARIVKAAPLKLESKITTSPLLTAFRPALANFDLAAAPQVESKLVVHHSAAPIAKSMSTRILPLPSMSSSYSYAPQAYAASYLNSYTAPKYYSSAPKYLAAPQYYSSSASYAPQYYSSAAAYAPQYYSSSAAYAPQYYSSSAAYAPQYYSSAAAYAPQYYSSAAAYAPQYYSAAPKYSTVSVAADEPCDK